MKSQTLFCSVIKSKNIMQCKKVRNIAVAISALCVFFLIIFYICQERYHKKIECDLQTTKNSLFGLKNCLFEQISLNRRSLHDFCEQIDDFFVDFPDSNKVLIYRCSLTMCEACIESDMNILMSYKQQFNPQKILLLISYPNNRDYKIKAKIISNIFSVHRIENNCFPIPEDTDNIPRRYFAILDKKNDSIEYIYYPCTSSENVTKMYLESVLPMIDSQ